MTCSCSLQDQLKCCFGGNLSPGTRVPPDAEKLVTELVQGHTLLMYTVEWCHALMQEGGEKRRIFELINLIHNLTID